MPKPRAQRNPSKLSAKQHDIVKQLRADGRTIGAIANNLSLPQDTIRRIVYGDDYKDKVQLFPAGNILQSHALNLLNSSSYAGFRRLWSEWRH